MGNMNVIKSIFLQFIPDNWQKVSEIVLKNSEEKTGNFVTVSLLYK